MRLIFLAFVFFGCTSSLSNFFDGYWYIEGEDVSFEFSGSDLRVLSTEDRTILVKASREESSLSSGSSIGVYRILWSASSSFIKAKYPVGKFIHFKGLLEDGNKRVACSLKLPLSAHFVRYYLSRSAKTKNIYYSSLLFPFERKSFLESIDFTPLSSLYSISSFSTVNNSNGFPKFILDRNHNTYWSVYSVKNAFSNSLEFLFYDKLGKRLAYNLPLRAVGFVLYPSLGVYDREGNYPKSNSYIGGINNFKDDNLFHRVKTVSLAFTKSYEGGLGYNNGRYSNERMDVSLKDVGGLQVVYFLKDIYVRGLRINIRDIYPGSINELRLYELIFYIKD